MDGPGGAPARRPARVSVQRVPGAAPERDRRVLRQARRRARARAAGDRHRQPGRQRRPACVRPDEPRLPQDLERRRAGRVRADGGGVDRRRQRRAVADRERHHLLPHDLGLPRPDRLPARQRLDRGHGVVLQAPGGRRVSRRLPDPPCRGQGRPRGLGHRGAGAGPGDRGAGRLQRDAEPGRGPLRDRGHPPASRRFRRRRGIAPGGARQGPIPTARAGPGAPRGGQGAGRAQGDQRCARGEGLGPLDALASAAGAGRDRGGGGRPGARPQGRRGAERADRDLLVAGARGQPGGRAGPRPARGGQRDGGRPCAARSDQGMARGRVAVRGGSRPCAAREEPAHGR